MELFINGITGFLQSTGIYRIASAIGEYVGWGSIVMMGVACVLMYLAIGRKFEQNGCIHLPLAIQVHHAVCDGYHICMFVNTLREKIKRFIAQNGIDD